VLVSRHARSKRCPLLDLGIVELMMRKDFRGKAGSMVGKIKRAMAFRQEMGTGKISEDKPLEKFSLSSLLAKHKRAKPGKNQCLHWPEGLSTMLFLLLAAACTPKPKPTSPPPPPTTQPHPTVQRLKPGPDDIVIHNCILTREGKATADCLCRHATTKIDSVTGDHSLECRVKKTK